MVGFPKYESYKDSGVEWLGEIPSHWQLLRTKNIFHLVTEPAPKNNDEELLSVYSDIGVKPRKELEERGNKASTTDGYWFVKKGDVVVNKLLAWMGAIGVSDYDGVTSPAYDILRAYKAIDSKFYHYLFRNPICISKLKQHSKGIMEMRLRLYFDEFGNIKIPYPPIEEQKRIVEFLDRKTSEIDQAIAQKQRLIELLQEQKAILINQAVTKGLDPNVPMCDRGVDWIGEIPAHWDVVRSRYLFKEQNERSLNGSEIHLCMSQKLGLVPSDELKEKTLQSESYEGAKLCKKADLVLNRLKAHLGVFSVARCDGLVSPDYSVFRLQNQDMTPEYFENLFKTNQYISEFNKRVKGIVVGFYRLYTDAFNDIACLCPPETEQVEIRNWIFMLNQEFRVVENAINTEIEKLTELKTVLVSNAVTGKIKV